MRNRVLALVPVLISNTEAARGLLQGQDMLALVMWIVVVRMAPRKVAGTVDADPS
jgi:hypothetical protein